MYRSKVNLIIRESIENLNKNKFKLPQWSEWKIDKWKKNLDLCKKISLFQLGWDITDFGTNNFEKVGLVLFSLRNGSTKVKESIPYAEKLMIMRPGQRIPYHFHKLKKEDIINRYGGILELGAYNYKLNKSKSLKITIDYEVKNIIQKKIFSLKEGQSVTLFPKIYHFFQSSKKNKDLLILGEVSTINDDNNDNYFSEKNPRFNKIIEDEKIDIPTWKDIENLISE